MDKTFFNYNKKIYMRNWRANVKANKIILIKKDSIVKPDIYNTQYNTSREKTRLKSDPRQTARPSGYTSTHQKLQAAV